MNGPVGPPGLVGDPRVRWRTGGAIQSSANILDRQIMDGGLTRSKLHTLASFFFFFSRPWTYTI